MRKLLLAGMAIAMMAAPAFAQTYRFAIVPKAMNNPFFDVARDGCLKRAKELGNVECIYKGPVEHEPATQAQIIQDFVTQKVDGLAISVADVAAMTKSIDAATAAGIPVITFDADAPGSKRIAYIGTDNKDFGLALGKQLLQLRPDGGKYAIVSGGPGAKNLAERVDGVRDALKGSKWVEVSGSPPFCNDDPALARPADDRSAHRDAGSRRDRAGRRLADVRARRLQGLRQQEQGRTSTPASSRSSSPIRSRCSSSCCATAIPTRSPASGRSRWARRRWRPCWRSRRARRLPEIIYTGLDLVTKDNVAQLLK